jgi:hypothetical protein
MLARGRIAGDCDQREAGARGAGRRDHHQRDPAGAVRGCAIRARRRPPAADCSLAETHWKSVESIGTLAAYQDHLARFPNCVFSTLATARIEALRK